MTTKPTTGSNKGKKAKGTGRKVTKPPKGVLHKRWLQKHGRAYRERLLQNIKAQLPRLEKLLREADVVSRSGKDDDSQDDIVTVIYRRQQTMNRKIYTALQDLMQDRPMRKLFSQMVAEGIDQEFESADSDDLFKRMLVVKAFVHAQFFLELACRKGRELETLPDESDTDWGALLKLFDLK